MIKEDTSGDTNKLYWTLHEVESLYSEDCKMGTAKLGWKVKNKEQGRGK